MAWLGYLLALTLFSESTCHYDNSLFSYGDDAGDTDITSETASAPKDVSLAKPIIIEGDGGQISSLHVSILLFCRKYTLLLLIDSAKSILLSCREYTL